MSDPQKFERQVIHRCLKDESFAKVVVVRAAFEDSDFSDQFSRACYKHIKSLLIRDSEVTPETVSSEIEKDTSLPKLQKPIWRKNLSTMDFAGSTEYAEYSLEELIDWKRKTTLFRDVLDLTESLKNNKDVDDLASIISKMQSSLSTNVLEELPEDFISADKYEERNIKQNERRNDPTQKEFFFIDNLRFLQDSMMGGIYSPSITTIGGLTSIGKSTFLKNICRCAILPPNQMNVLCVVSEDNENLTQDKFDAILTGKSYGSMKYRNINDKEGKEFYKGVEGTYGKLFVKRVKNVSFNTAYIQSLLLEYQDKGIKIHMLAIDSPDHMQSMVKHREVRHAKHQVYMDIKLLNEQFDLITFTTIPMNASALGKDVVGNEDVSEAKAISNLTDINIMFLKSSADMQEGLRRCQFTKNRDGVVDNKIFTMKIASSLRFEEFKQLNPLKEPEEFMNDEDDVKPKKRVYRLKAKDG